MPPFHTGSTVIYKGAEEKNRRAYKNARNTAPRIPPFKKQINETKKKYLFIPFGNFKKSKHAAGKFRLDSLHELLMNFMAHRKIKWRFSEFNLEYEKEPDENPRHVKKIAFQRSHDF